MTREKIEACPFEAATRADRCESCCANTGGLTPCVAAWLAARAGHVELVQPERQKNPHELARELRHAA